VKLRGPDHWTWLGLRRVNCGAVARLEGAFYDDGRPFSGCLYPDLIEALIERNLLDVADPDEKGRQRVVLSEAGGAEYRALCRRRRRKEAPEQMPAPVNGSPSTSS
jgi:hypothetical protein